MDKLNKIKTILSLIARVPPESITIESRFVEDLRMDSLDSVELILKLEEDFDIYIYPHEEKELHKKQTVQGVLDYINKKVGGK